MSNGFTTRCGNAVERVFVGNYQMSILHFYPVGKSPDEKQRFAFGYMTPDAVFHQGVTVVDSDGDFTTEYSQATV